jgi:hypothetical protein
MVRAHYSVLSEAQREAKAETCEKCGGGGRMSMWTGRDGSWEMGWICWTCEPNERRFWAKWRRRQRPSRLRVLWRKLCNRFGVGACREGE